MDTLCINPLRLKVRTTAVARKLKVFIFNVEGFTKIDTLLVLNCHTVENRHLEVCLECSRLLNDNSKLKSDDYTLWQL